ncbi:hypothetical protein PTKIN_Ptkin05aG0025100 [Pterospermum kingtungense]
MKIAEDLRNALLVVAGVIIAAPFQADSGNPTIINGTYINATATNTTDDGGGSPSSDDAGKSVMDAIAFLVFSVSNSSVLCIVVGVIGLLLADGLFGVKMLAYLLVCYAVSIYVILPDMIIAAEDLSLLSFFIMFLISVLAFYSRGKAKIRQLCYNAKCPMEAMEDEDQKKEIDSSV